jgi:hypothetical protein
MRSRDDRWQPGNHEKNLAAIRELTTLADAKGIMDTQSTLAWLLTQGDDIVPIPGHPQHATGRREHRDSARHAHAGGPRPRPGDPAARCGRSPLPGGNDAVLVTPTLNSRNPTPTAKESTECI